MSLCHFSEQEALLENVSLYLCPAWFVWFLLVSNCFITVRNRCHVTFSHWCFVGFFFSPTLLLCEHFLQLFSAGKI